MAVKIGIVGTGGIANHHMHSLAEIPEAQRGGQVVEQTTHIFDLARYLLGEVKSIHSTVRIGLILQVEDYEHDASVTNLRLKAVSWPV